jgi:hypothetical protein
MKKRPITATTLELARRVKRIQGIVAQYCGVPLANVALDTRLHDLRLAHSDLESIARIVADQLNTPVRDVRGLGDDSKVGELIEIVGRLGGIER